MITADFAIESAYGDYGEGVIDSLEAATKRKFTNNNQLNNSLIHKNHNNHNSQSVLNNQNQHHKQVTLHNPGDGNNNSLTQVTTLTINNGSPVIQTNGHLKGIKNGNVNRAYDELGDDHDVVDHDVLDQDGEINLNEIQTTATNSHKDYSFMTPIKQVVKRRSEKACSPSTFFSHTYLLLIRNWVKISRDPGQLWLRLFQNIAIGLMVSYLWKPDIGAEDGCWADFLDLGKSLGSSSGGTNSSNIQNLYLQKISKINANSALLFSFLIYVVMVSVMSTVLSFPTETLVIIKEIQNSWYSTSTYYWSKFVAELPILFLTILVLAGIIYPLTGQIPVLWRFLLVYGFTVLMGEVCQSIGMLFGTIFSDDLISACFSSVASGFPPILFGGFVVQVSQIRWYLKPLAYLSYVRYAFESLVVSIYGFGRCQRELTAGSTTNVAEQISKATNPITLIGTLVSSFNLTAKDASTFSVLLNVDSECIAGVINGTIDYFGIGNHRGGGGGGGNSASGIMGHNSTSDNDYDDGDYDDPISTTISSIISSSTPAYSLPAAKSTDPDDSGQSASYVLSYFTLDENVLWGNFAALMTFVIFFRFLTYYVLARKVRTGL